MTLEIETTRGILKLKSAPARSHSRNFHNVIDINLLNDIELPELRRQDTKNRQNSIDDLDPEVVEKLNRQMVTLFSSASNLYQQMLGHGVAKGMCRFVLPLNSNKNAISSGPKFAAGYIILI